MKADSKIIEAAFFSILAVTLLALLAVSAMSVAEENSNDTTFTVGDLKYGILPDNKNVTVEGLADEKTGVTEITIPETVTSPDKITYPVIWIHEGAFYGNTTLTKATISGSVREIGSKAFYGCTALKTVILNEGTTDIGLESFSECDSLESIVMPSTMEEIYKSAFYGCESLKTVTLNEGLSTIVGSAFMYCTSLETIEIPSTIGAIHDSVFANCNSLKTVKLNEGLKSIEERAFNKCINLETIEIPDSVTVIAEGAFYDDEALKSVGLPKSLTTIGNQAFAGCKLLTEVNMPDGVKTIGYSAFSACSGLKTLRLNSGLTNIGNYAFLQCVPNTIVFGTFDGNVTVGTKPFVYVDGESFINITFQIDGETVEFTQDTYQKFSGKGFVYDEVNKTYVGAKKVTFDANGGTCDVSSMFVNADGKLSSLPTATREGYTFDGWYDGNTKITTDTVFTKDTTVTAKWISATATYTVTFNANGGTCDVTTMKTGADGKLSSLPTATREGYTFDGWYDGDTKITTDTVFTKDTTVTAKWTATPADNNDFNWALLVAFIVAILAVVYVAVICRN